VVYFGYRILVPEPNISDIPDLETPSGTPVRPVSFTVADTDTPLLNLSFSASSADPLLIPVQNIVFGGSGAHRTLSIIPTQGRVGTAKITVTVSDGVFSSKDSFLLTVGLAPPSAATAPRQSAIVEGDYATLTLGAAQRLQELYASTQFPT